MLPPLTEIDDPLTAPGWRASLPDDEGALHAQLLRELCDGARALHVGAAGASGVAASLQLVDVLQQQIVLATQADGIAVARALQCKPVWAAARLKSLRVQFALHAPSVVRESVGLAGAAGGAHERFVIRARWPREIYRTSRRHAPRAVRGPFGAPVARLHSGSQLVSTREFALLDISEAGGALLLPSGMAAPAPESRIHRVELELDDEHILFTDAVVTNVLSLRRGMHRVGCRWEGMPEAAQRQLRHWLATAAERAPKAPMPV